jgi:hypothetical protein
VKAATVLKHLPKEFHQDAPGKPWKPVSNSDRLSARMNVLTKRGVVQARARGSRERSRLGRHGIAIRKWREGRPGAEADLATFEGQTVGG